MRLLTAILAVVAVAAPALAASTTPAPSAGSAPTTVAASEATPKVFLPEMEYQFGQVQPRDVLQHVFVIRNEGKAPLEITKVSASCKCTAVTWDHVIPPGGSGKLVAAVDTRLLEGDSTGELTVETNDPAKPKFVLQTHVEVRSKLFASPGYARWNMVQGEPEGTISQTIWSLDGSDFHVLKVNAPPSIRTSFRAATADEAAKHESVKGPQWHVEATLSNEAAVGPLTGYVEVVTDHPLQPNIRIPISGFVRPVVHVTPEVADFGQVSPENGEGHGKVFFQSFATENINVTNVQSTVKGAKVSFSPIESGRKYAIEVKLDPKMPTGPFQGVVKIQTDSKRAPLIEVPVKGVVQHGKSAGAASSGTTAH